MTNRLAGETSPYLLQHKTNPVEWWPWGPEAMAEAKATNRPILLSVGYAACHWCHVMAHESFENPEIAQLMNNSFINVKVDREERPDLDTIYQQALGMMGQHGGWPLTMFLTPAGEPFWGGTYFPPTPRYGRPAFPEIIRAVTQAWTGTPDKVMENVGALKSGLAQNNRNPAAAELSLDMLDQGAKHLAQAVDTEYGGLRGAPKFPQTGVFDFLWRAGLRTGDEALKEAVTLTLDRMSYGGIYDHLGGGFMRYCTEETWLVPHFEKMLYDNAQLIELLTLVWQDTGETLYQTRVAETVEWVLRDMTAEGGAFAATVDADSEGHEGKFYTWTATEIDQLLEADAARWFKQAYDVRPEGNWEGTTILHRNHQPQPVGVEDILADARAVLWREREARIHPGRDDKILADWNGMMIAALANASFVFSMPRWLDAARVAYETVRTRMALPGARLAHSMRFGRFRPIGLVDDLAHMARAALALHEITGEPELVEHARAWVDAAERHHWDAGSGGYFQAADDADDIIVRVKPIHDSAVPSANGIMVQVLARLAQITGDNQYRSRADATLDAFSGLVPEHFANMTALLAGFEQLAEPVQVVVVGEPEQNDTQALLRAVAETSLPTRVLEQVDGIVLPAGHPAHGKGAVDGQATAYVCRGFTCSPPVTDAAALRDQLHAR
ncbi:MAG: thioredoxin domain-containing protein [Rhodospirillaceae bacterium]|nr:thioredoxin domain-containing protein [Rhodospirillales bacterium]